MDDLLFTGRVVWVTGCARGQGARHVERFAAAGARVGAIDVDDEPLGALADRVRSQGGEVEPACSDVASWPAMRDAGVRLTRAMGDPDVLVVNAGIVGEVAPVESLDVTAWANVIAVNLTGAFHTVKAALPGLRQGRPGNVVLVGSAASFFAYPGYSAYSASKHGLIGLMRALANELGSDGVRVNAVCPGWVDTPMLDSEAAATGLPRQEAVEGWVKEHLIERLITPDEVSDAVMWLASDAARMVTGTALPVDGGQLVRRGQGTAGGSDLALEGTQPT